MKIDFSPYSALPLKQLALKVKANFWNASRVDDKLHEAFNQALHSHRDCRGSGGPMPVRLLHPLTREFEINLRAPQIVIDGLVGDVEEIQEQFHGMQIEHKVEDAN